MTGTPSARGVGLLVGTLLALTPAAGAEPLPLGRLQAIMPHLSQEKAEAYLEPLNKGLAEFDIDAPKRRAAFLAQLAHESGELRTMEEIASGEAYQGRKD